MNSCRQAVTITEDKLMSLSVATRRSVQFGLFIYNFVDNPVIDYSKKKKKVNKAALAEEDNFQLSSPPGDKQPNV